MRADSHTAEPSYAGHRSDTQRTRWNRWGLFVLLALAGLHTMLVWGYGGLFWGDQGRWLHEIDRYASGQVVYRDFYWGFPPLAMWLLGGYSRLFGSDLTSIWIATSAIFFCITALYYAYVAKLVTGRLALPTAACAWLLAVAYVTASGAPLPLGTYTPAAAIGFLFLIAAIVVLVDSFERTNALRGCALGLLCALCILSKQDYWPPALFVLGAAIAANLFRNQRNPLVALLTGGIFLITLATATAVIIAQSGFATLLGMLGGFGNAAEYVGRGFPSWERLTVEVVAGVFLVGVVLLCLLLGQAVTFAQTRGLLLVLAGLGVAAVTLYIAMGFRIAGAQPVATSNGLPPMAEFVAALNRRHVSLLKPLLGFLRDSVQLRLFPVLLPGIVLMTVLWKRPALRTHSLFRRVLLLLGLCITARLRRLFEGVEWFHFLLELPVYVMVLQLLLLDKARDLERGLRLALVALTLLGGYAYFRLGHGPFTQRGTWEAVQTPRGVYRMPAAQANDFRRLQASLSRLDPGGERPLFAFGYSGGFNYFLNRPNSTPLSQGFMLANALPIEVVVALKHGQHAPIVLDNRAYDRIGVPVSRLSWATWEIPTKRVHYWRFDRTYFNILKRGCWPLNTTQEKRPMFTLYDCARRP